MRDLTTYIMESTTLSSNRQDTVKHFIFSKSKNKKFIIAAPHGADIDNMNIKSMLHFQGVDVDKIKYRDYDGNTENVAKELGKMLDAEVINLVNADKDYNKIVGETYLNYINTVAPKYLIEIHTHRMQYIDSNKVEVSCGKDKNKLSSTFSLALQKQFDKYPQFREISVNGNYRTIFYKASKTASVNGTGYNMSADKNTIHVELPQIICTKTNSKILAKIFYDAIQDCL